MLYKNEKRMIFCKRRYQLKVKTWIARRNSRRRMGGRGGKRT
jgi:hypothetical protein